MLHQLSEKKLATSRTLSTDQVVIQKIGPSIVIWGISSFSTHEIIELEKWPK